MYIPKYFRETDLTEVKKFIKKNSFATLVSFDGSMPIATHIPLEPGTVEEGEMLLVGHISKGNKQWKTLDETKDVLAIFTGAHTYVSSSWYNHPNVPTWNYMAIHLYGKPGIMDEEELYDSLEVLMNRYESGSENPVSMETLPERLVKRQIKAIVGFKIKVHTVEAAYKLSQNRDDESYQNIIRELKKIEEVNAREVAEVMRQRRD